MDYVSYIGIYLLILIIPLIASWHINSTYKKYKKVENKNKLSGFEVARKVLDANGLNNLYIVEVKGELTDHYDPKQKVVRLSTDIFHGETIAAAAVAAHECGHAIQDKEAYPMMRLRSSLVPVVNLITYAAYIMFAISIFLQMFNLLMISIVSVLFGLVFQIVTLPVEFDASKRALKNLKDLGLVDNKEHQGTQKMLRAAAFTYVAAVLSSLLNLLRLLMAYSNSRGRR
ncbi:MAG: zinc metallopeptidase [Bacilli bacterium]|nr:zinc metallopeptidase [Bacilli bacterium]